MVILSVIIFFVGCTPDNLLEDEANDVIITTWSATGDTIYVADEDTSAFMIYSELVLESSLAKDSTKLKYYCSKGQIEEKAYTVDGQAQVEYKPVSNNGEVLYGNVMIRTAYTKKTTFYDTLNLNFQKNYGNENIVVSALYPQTTDSLNIMESGDIRFKFKAHSGNDQELEYYWYADDLEVATGVTEYTFTGDADFNEGAHSIALKILNSAGTSLTFNWSVAVVHVPVDFIILSLLPGEDNSLFKISEGDSLRFNCIALDPEQGELSYRWILDNDTVSTDSTYLLKTDFNDHGLYTMELLLASTDSLKNRYKDSLFTWQVEVADVDGELVINEISPAPESTFNILEGDSIPFMISAYDLDQVPLNYKWLLNDSLISTDSVYTYIADSLSEKVNLLSLEVNDSTTVSGSKSAESYSWIINVEKNTLVVDSMNFTDGEILNLTHPELRELKVFAHDEEDDQVNYEWYLSSNENITTETVSTLSSYTIDTYELEDDSYTLKVKIWSKESYEPKWYSVEINVSHEEF